MENIEHIENWNTIGSYIAFEVCPREQWRTLSTLRTGEHGMLASWIVLEVTALENIGEHRAHGEYGILASCVALNFEVITGEQWSQICGRKQ